MSGEPRFRRSRRQRTRWDTQDAAWESVQATLPDRQRTILNALAGNPMTCDELEQVLEGLHQSISPTLLALREKNLIRAIDTRRTRTGRMANVYRVVLEGEWTPPLERRDEPGTMTRAELMEENAALRKTVAELTAALEQAERGTVASVSECGLFAEAAPQKGYRY